MDDRFIVGLTIVWFLMMAVSAFGAEVILDSPANESSFTTGNITLKCNVTDNFGIVNVSLWGNFTGDWLLNQTLGMTAKPANWNFTIPANYTYNVSAVKIETGEAKLKGDKLDAYGHWHLNESSGTLVSDVSGYNRDGTAINIEDADWVSGKLANALSLDGIAEYVNLGDIANFERNETFTFEFWFKTSTSSVDVFLDRYGSSRGWSIYMDSGKIVIVLTNSIGNYIKKETTGTYNDNAWHHLIITYDGSSTAGGVIIYIDGEVVSITTISNTLSATIKNDNFNCSLGSRQTALYYEGIIDEVVIYNSTLSQAFVTRRYNYGSGTEVMVEINYPQNNPNVSSNFGLSFHKITQFNETSTKPNSTEIKYQISNDNGSSWLWYNGILWTASNGSYEEANNASEVNSNIDSLTAGTFNFNAFLHTHNNNNTPELDQIAVLTDEYPLSYNATFYLYYLPDNTYIWNCQAYDNDSVSAWYPINWSFIITPPFPFGFWVTSPQTKIYTDAEINLSVYANKSVDSWKYSLNFGANNSFTPNTTIYPTSFEDNIIDIYAQNYTDWAHERVEFYYIPKTRLMFEDWDLLEPKTVITNKTCVGSTENLEWVTSVWRCIGDACMWVNQTQLEYCEYGCDPVTCSCMPAPFMQHIWILVFVLGMAGIFAFIMKVR